MESRGNNPDCQQKEGRPAIARRSCDQCRTRKVGCDRGSPCSNCISARLACTHSAVASNRTPPKQRVLISAQYEQKIDDIAKGVDGIKLLLRRLDVPAAPRHHANSSTGHLIQDFSTKSVVEQQHKSSLSSEPQWSYSAHIVDFLRAVVDDQGRRDVSDDEDKVLSSLRNLLQSLDDPSPAPHLSLPVTKLARYAADSSMPPLEATVAVLRWAKAHDGYIITNWISQILPLEMFTNICQKVYFSVNDYSETDFIIANGYLSYIFLEYVVVSGIQDYRQYSHLCGENLHTSLARLPLLLPPSMELVAALALGAFNAIESSKVSPAWNFISAALNTCQTLGYHRFRPLREDQQSLRVAQENLFWTVYKIEKGLSVRLGRASNIRDAEITLPSNLNEPRNVRLGRIQGKAYEHLYSPKALSQADSVRGKRAETLARELRDLINEVHAEISKSTCQLSDSDADSLRAVYLQCDLVCQSSLLALILRATPPTLNSQCEVSDECVAVSRDVLDIHERCITGVRNCKSDPSMVTKYLNWGILNVPFVPFSILFTRAVQLSDTADLARLDRFTASLQPEAASPESTTHPYRLYKLLGQAARLYTTVKASQSDADGALAQDAANSLGEFDFAHLDMELGFTTSESVEPYSHHGYNLSDWYYENQQLVNLLDGDTLL